MPQVLEGRRELSLATGLLLAEDELAAVVGDLHRSDGSFTGVADAIVQRSQYIKSIIDRGSPRLGPPNKRSDEASGPRSKVGRRRACKR